MNNEEEQKRWRKREEKLLYDKTGWSQQKKEKRTYFVPVLDSDNLQCFSDHQKSRITLPKIDQCQLKTHPHEKPVQHRESKAPCPKEERTDFKPSLGKQPQQKHRFFKGLRLPMSPAEALRAFGHHLTEFEREEILDYSEIWYLGLQSPKINSSKSSPQNNGYDDSQTYYLQVLHDHIAYRFEVLDVLGQGIYGQVLKCWDHKEEEFVAIKLLRSKNCFYQYGKKEVKILEVLRKTDKMNVYNVVHMKDNFCFRKHLCITFELLGITLEEKKRANKHLSMSEVRKYTTSLLKCLSLLKKEKIMHCDLKPDNIVLSNENPDSLKVIDFGLSCYEKDAKGNSHIQALPYCSPEVILGHICGVAIDMWSLGCIIFELCTGHMLFQGWNKAEQLSLMIEALGMLPQDFFASAPYKNMFFDSNGMLIQNSEKEIQQPRRDALASMLRTKDPHLLDFIKRCLEWDPKKRMMPDEAMQHPWILQHKESSRSNFSLKRRDTTTDMARKSCDGMEVNLLGRRKLSPLRLPRLESTKRAQVRQKANRAEKVNSVVLRPPTTNGNQVIRIQLPQIPQAEEASLRSFRSSRPMSGRPNRTAVDVKMHWNLFL